MPADAAEGNAPAIGRRQHRADAACERPDRHARGVVQAVNGVTWEAIEQPIRQHRQCAAAAFFGRLKNQVQRAAEIGMLGQVFRRAQQHGGVPVMAAGVHLAGLGRGVGQACRLVDRERIHIRA